MQSGIGADAAAPPYLRPELTHGVSQHPEGAVQFYILVDTGDRARGHRATRPRATVQSKVNPFDEAIYWEANGSVATPEKI
jgi:hypothetical protein